MDGRRRVMTLILVMSMVAIGVGWVTLYFLYEAALDQQKERLIETARSRARLVEAILRHEESFESDFADAGHPPDALSATLGVVGEAHEKFAGFGRTGEFTLARRQADQIVFLLSHRHYDLEHPRPVPLSSTIAEPMRRALRGKSGTLIGLDYRGETVLAAHEPVGDGSLGIVAKIDLSEIREPFLGAGLLGGSVGLVFVSIGTLLFFRIGNPMIRRLEDSERKYRGLFDAAADMMFLADLDGTVLDANESAAAHYGYAKNELIGLPIARLVHLDYHDSLASALTALSSGNIYHVESVDVRKDGTCFDSEVRISLLVHDGRKRMLAAIRDITERRQTETRLENRTHDLAERVKELNCLYGISSLAAAGDVSLPMMVRKTLELIPPAWQFPEITCARITIGDEVYQSERFQETARKQFAPIMIDGKQGGAVEVYYREQPPACDHGPFLREEQSLITAIAERLACYVKGKAVEDELQRQRDNLVAIYDAMEDGVCVVTQDYRIQYANSALEKDFGPWRGRRFHQYFRGRTSVCPGCKGAPALSGKTVRWEWHSTRTGKTYDVIDAPLRDADGRISRLEMYRDVTSRKKAEQGLRALNETLEQRVAERTASAERRAAQLRELTSELTQAEQRERQGLAQILHDHVQQLLFGAKMYLGVARKTAAAEEAAQCLAKIEEALDCCIATSRSLTIELYPPALKDENLVNVMQWLASWMFDQHRLKVELEVETERVEVDEDVRVLAFQAARELLFNVRKHAKIDHACVRLRSGGPGELRIVIADEGAGFDRTERSWADASTGYGLSRIRQRLELLGGRLEVDSTPGNGTRMTVVVPAFTPQQQTPGSDSREGDAPRRPAHA